MLITTIQELRLVSPSHAFDTIDGILCNIFPDRTGSVFSGRVLDGNGIFGYIGSIKKLKER